jgi:hypothetical protein
MSQVGSSVSSLALILRVAQVRHTRQTLYSLLPARSGNDREGGLTGRRAEVFRIRTE